MSRASTAVAFLALVAASCRVRPSDDAPQADAATTDGAQAGEGIDVPEEAPAGPCPDGWVTFRFRNHEPIPVYLAACTFITAVQDAGEPLLERVPPGCLCPACARGCHYDCFDTVDTLGARIDPGGFFDWCWEPVYAVTQDAPSCDSKLCLSEISAEDGLYRVWGEVWGLTGDIDRSAGLMPVDYPRALFTLPATGPIEVPFGH